MPCLESQFYGIELGTTYSRIAHLDEYGRPVVLQNLGGDTSTPSVVYFESTDNVVVGAAAKQVAVMEGNQVIESVQRAMGDPDWTTEQHGREYHAQDVASFILRQLVADASVITGEEIKDVVITCPAYFGLAERQATEQAGRIAGLNVHHILPEPTAAAFAYGINPSQPQTIVVYDLGGGTFDVTVLRVEDGSIDVVCVGGDERLGGKNWDERIAEWMAHEFSGETGGIPADELIDHMETWQDLLWTAEKAKISLSSREKFTHRIRHGTGSAKVTLTRTKFNELTDELLERTLAVTEELLETARAKDQRCARIDKLLLVGGSTFMPQVKEAVTARFGFDVSFFDPTEAVAKGAALMAAKLEESQRVGGWAERRKNSRKPGPTSEPNDYVNLLKLKSKKRYTWEEVVKARNRLSRMVLSAPTETRRQEARRSLVIVDRAISDLGRTSFIEKLAELAEKMARESCRVTLPGISDDIRKVKMTNVTSKSFGIVVEEKGEMRVRNLIAKNTEVPVAFSMEVATAFDGQTGFKLRCVENDMSEGPEDPTVEFREEEIIGEPLLTFDRPMPRLSRVELTFSLNADGVLKISGLDKTTGQNVTATFETNWVKALAVPSSPSRRISGTRNAIATIEAGHRD